MNKKQLTSEQRAALENVKERFIAWREAKIGRARIPYELWDAAVALFHDWEMSINMIARSLRLNYTALKAKILEKPPVAVEPTEDVSTTFIEVQPQEICSDCVIDMENQSGTKMRICFRGRADPAVVNLGKFFLEAQP